MRIKVDVFTEEDPELRTFEFLVIYALGGQPEHFLIQPRDDKPGIAVTIDPETDK